MTPDGGVSPPPGDPGTEPAPHRPIGLREMKRQRTRAAIQQAGLRLFAERGYDRTTCEQIAAAAEVAPATFYRYFPTKEDVVLSDDYDELLALLARARPASEQPIRAVRRALAIAFEAFSDADTAAVRERLQLALSVPALRARRYEQARATEDVLARELAPRMGASPIDLRVKVTVAAIVAALIVGLEQWAQDGGRLAGHVDEALRALEERTASRPRR